MPINIVPEWMTNLDDEDVSFIKKFLLASGSLKELANIYSVTYPTVRLRLDRLIQKIHISEQSSSEPYVALIKQLAVNEKIDFETAKLLISEYKKNKKDMIQYENSTFNDSDSIFSYDSDCDNDRTADLPFQNETSLARSDFAGSVGYQCYIYCFSPFSEQSRQQFDQGFSAYYNSLLAHCSLLYHLYESS